MPHSLVVVELGDQAEQPGAGIVLAPDMPEDDRLSAGINLGLHFLRLGFRWLLPVLVEVLLPLVLAVFR